MRRKKTSLQVIITISDEHMYVVILKQVDYIHHTRVKLVTQLETSRRSPISNNHRHVPIQ